MKNILKEIRANTRSKVLYKTFWIAILLPSVVILTLAFGNQFIHLKMAQKGLIGSVTLGLIGLAALFTILSPWLIRLSYQKRIYIQDKLEELDVWKRQRQKYSDLGVDILQQDPLTLPPIPELMADWNEVEEKIKQALVKVSNNSDELKEIRDEIIGCLNETYNRSYFTALKAGLEKQALEILQNAEEEIHGIWNSTKLEEKKLRRNLENMLLEIAERKESLGKQAQDLQKNMYKTCQNSVAWADAEYEKVRRKIELARQLPG